MLFQFDPAEVTFNQELIYMFTESWSCDKLLQKAYFQASYIPIWLTIIFLLLLLSGLTQPHVHYKFTQVATLALAQWKLNIMKVQGTTKICSL